MRLTTVFIVSEFPYLKISGDELLELPNDVRLRLRGLRLLYIGVACVGCLVEEQKSE